MIISRSNRHLMEPVKIVAGLFLVLAIFALLFGNTRSVIAYSTGGDCTKYGFMSTYDYLSSSCKCMSGYVFQNGYLGTPQCVSADSVCSDKYGYAARYDSLSDTCGCAPGYILGKDSIGRTQCITEDASCQNQYGYHSRSSYGNQCTCSSGYGFGKDTLGQAACVTLDSICEKKYGSNSNYDSIGDKCGCDSNYELSVSTLSSSGLYCESCTTKHGINASYDYVTKQCGCNTGYTLDDSGQCVEKQNNAYFTLKEVDTDEMKAIIQSNYNFQYYLIDYGIGCYSYAFERYLDRNIVVNLGTDFNLNIWDKIVLQDDKETCNVTNIEDADSDTTLKPQAKVEKVYYIPPPTQVSPIPKIINTIVTPPQKNSASATKKPIEVTQQSKDFIVPANDILPFLNTGTLRVSAPLRKCPSSECSSIRYYAEGSEINIIGQYKDYLWYQISGTIDAGGTGDKVIGWISKALFSSTSVNINQKLSPASNVIPTTNSAGLFKLLPNETVATSTVSKYSFWNKLKNWIKFW